MPTEPETPFYDKERWMRSLEDVAHALGKEGPPVKLCLIGSAVCVLGNMPERASRGLDIWKPSSSYDTLEFKSAAEKAGIRFSPKDYIEPTEQYFQIVEPGIVQTGAFTPVLMEKMGRLEIYRPPIENIIASKLTRAAEKDIQDILYLLKAYQPDISEIKKIVHAFPEAAKAQGIENLIFLEVTL
jgi:hypothetical protein